jgi:FlaG/FlaF family flagellin (archaellin)
MSGRPRRRIRRDDAGVSPVIGVILSVAITAILAGIVFVITTNKDSGATEHEQIAFIADERGGTPGGILTVVSILRGPVDMAHLAVTGSSHSAAPCTWSRTSGDLQAGDQLTCTAPGSVLVTDIRFQFLLYSQTFS